MTLRRAFRPLRPDLDNFLFATIGTQADAIPLSVVSALTQVGVDPWAEAVRLLSLPHREAVEQLARLIVGVPGPSRTVDEAREIAGPLIERLPKRDTGPRRPQQTQISLHFHRPARLWPSQLWIAVVVLAAAVGLMTLIHNSFPFGIGGF